MVSGTISTATRNVPIVLSTKACVYRRHGANPKQCSHLFTKMEDPMRRIVLVLMFSWLALTGAMADESCKAQASDKKLAGAALTSFMKRCESDAQSA